MPASADQIPLLGRLNTPPPPEQIHTYQVVRDLITQALARNTPNWQLSVRPAVPEYGPCTPADRIPFFRKPAPVRRENRALASTWPHRADWTFASSSGR